MGECFAWTNALVESGGKATISLTFAINEDSGSRAVRSEQHGFLINLALGVSRSLLDRFEELTVGLVDG